MKQGAFTAFYRPQEAIEPPASLPPAAVPDRVPETMPATFRDRVAAYLKARPNQWIDGRDLGVVGGAYAWRSRVSDCRLELGMTIQNRPRKVPSADGEGFFVVSEYRFVPTVMKNSIDAVT